MKSSDWRNYLTSSLSPWLVVDMATTALHSETTLTVPP